VSLLVVAQPALAQFGDPAGLFTTGAVIPMLGSPNVSVLELSSPVGPNYVLQPPFPPNPGGRDVHLVFFSDACTRNNSLNIPMTTNDVEVFSLANVANYNGLTVIAATPDFGITIQTPLNPLHARMHIFNLEKDFAKVFDPITILHAERVADSAVWNPLRSAASFFAPPEGSTFNTTLYIVCPGNAITGKSDDPVIPGDDTVGALIQGAPPLPSATPGNNGAASTITGIVYDDEEKGLRDVRLTCSCLTIRTLTAIDPVYADVGAAPLGTFTELFGGSASTPRIFTGWRQIQITDGILEGGELDDFSRLNNGYRGNIGAPPNQSQVNVTQDAP
jgi:hypothetical protein